MFKAAKSKQNSTRAGARCVRDTRIQTRTLFEYRDMQLFEYRDMQLFEYRSVRYWSKEINGTRTGGQNGLFNSRPTARPGPRRPRQLKPVNPWP